MKKIVIGLTGQTGSGKSTCSNYLKDSGYHIIDADICAREVLDKGTDCFFEVKKTFGDIVIFPDGSLNRKQLANIIFNDKNELNKLNGITNPYIIDNINDKISRADNGIIILDAPTLFESGADKLCNYTICVIAPIQVRLERIISRDKLTTDEAKSRINSQNNDEFYISRSNYMIDNNSNIDKMILNINSIIDDIKAIEDI